MSLHLTGCGSEVKIDGASSLTANFLMSCELTGKTEKCLTYGELEYYKST